MERDQNLLFGAMAVQFNVVPPAELVKFGTGPANEPDADLGRWLVDEGLLSPRDRDPVTSLVEQALEGHNADPAATAMDVGMRAQILRAFGLPADNVDRGNGDPPLLRETPGHYKRVAELARGGIDRILLVHDVLLDLQVALKELLPTDASNGADTPTSASATKVARFLREARITGRLEHPSILPVYERGRRPDGTPYYTMKLI